MRTNSIAVALGLCAVMLLATAAPAQHKKVAKHKRVRHHAATKKSSASMSGAETSLAGIKLFDSGARVVAVYGSPDVIEAVTLGGTAAGPGGGAGGGAGGRGLPGPAGAGRSGGAAGASSDFTGPYMPGDFDFGGDVFNRQGRAVAPGQGPTAGLSGPSGPPGGPGGPPGGPPGGGPGGGGGASSDRVVYTRWVYNRNASKFGFIVDKWNHVIQCEAIGIQAGKVRTRRGVTFGSTFAQIINKYSTPDGYEISGDNIVVRYLSKDKCAFRLNRLGENKPYVVTGIVVAAGKR